LERLRGAALIASPKILPNWKVALPSRRVNIRGDSWQKAVHSPVSASPCLCSLPDKRSQRESDFATAKIVVFAASILSALVGTA
jgi:hypothetical protein